MWGDWEPRAAIATEDVDMSTHAAVADWIKRIVDDERLRDADRARKDEMAARKADLDHRNGRRLIDDLRVTITRDVEAFRDEFVGDRARNITVAPAARDGGFTVSKPGPSAVSLEVKPNLETASTIVHYRWMLSHGLPPREDRFDVIFGGDEGESPVMKHHGTGQVFPTIDALSEFLLVPVFTGRPR
jgi:hypothetical protein